MVGISPRIRGVANIQTQWQNIVTVFGIPRENIWIRGEADEIYTDFPQVIRTCEDLPGKFSLVVLQPQTAEVYPGLISLVDFQHPEDAIYVFGSNKYAFSVERDLGKREPEHRVYIPVQGELFSWSAAALVLYDRIWKQCKET